MKGKSSYKLQKEFPELKKKFWRRHFWGRGYFSTTSGNVTDEIINEYINNHIDAHSPYGVVFFLAVPPATSQIIRNLEGKHHLLEISRLFPMPSRL